MTKFRVWSFSISLLLAFVASVVAAPPTPIRKLPYVIQTGGVYTLTRNLIAPAGATGITVDADDVVIDLGGHTIAGDSAQAPPVTYGINIQPRKNVVVRNGTIRSFSYGIRMGAQIPQTNAAHQIEAVRILDCKIIGVYFEDGSVGCSVQNCTIAGIGPSDGGPAYGVDIRGNGHVLTGNRIQSSSVGVGVNGGQAILVSGNYITAQKWGILFQGGGTGLRSDNTVLGAATPYQGGTDGGGNR